MLRKLRPRLTYANVMATVAVFIALGGSAYAAATITGAEVVDESLTGADIQGKNGTSTKAGVNGSIRTEDVYGQPSIPGVQPSINGGLPVSTSPTARWPRRILRPTPSTPASSRTGR